MNDFKTLISELLRFRDARNWKQFHNSKDLALALSIEAAELNELFLWKTIEESDAIDKTKIKEELADIFIFGLLLAHKYGLNVKEIILDKIEENNRKYPVEKSKNSAKKYNEF